MPQIERTGTIHFGDASFSIWEEGLGGTPKERDNWERKFKREVFARIIQQLNRLGWTVGPWEDAAHYKAIANNHRSCNKGPLRGELEASGRIIKFEMFQAINCPTRPDHEGRYESDKEGVMPYLLRLDGSSPGSTTTGTWRATIFTPPARKTPASSAMPGSAASAWNKNWRRPLRRWTSSAPMR